MLQDFSTVAHTYWTQFLFVLPRLLVAAVLLAVVWLASGRLRSYLTGKLAAHSADPLLTNFLTQVGRWLLVLGGVLLALQIVGFSGVVGGLLGGLDLSAFLVGFAFKDIAENFLAGVIPAFNRPFNINDSIQIKDFMGRVVELNLRTTRIKTFDGKDIYVPNSLVLKEPVTNFTRDGNIQVFFWAASEEYRRGVLQLRSRLLNGCGLPSWPPTMYSCPPTSWSCNFPKPYPSCVCS